MSSSLPPALKWHPQLKHASLPAADVHHIQQCISDMLGRAGDVNAFLDDDWDADLLITSMGMLRAGKMTREWKAALSKRYPGTKFSREAMFVATVVTLPQFRRKGNAAQMFAALIDRYGSRELVLEVKQDNAPAIALYQKFGFVVGHKALSGDVLLMTRPFVSVTMRGTQAEEFIGRTRSVTAAAGKSE